MKKTDFVKNLIFPILPIRFLPEMDQYCMCVWEWIAATVQAMRFHLEMKLNRGGTVAAISLSTMQMRSAACPAVMLIIVQHLEFDIFTDGF